MKHQLILTDHDILGVEIDRFTEGSLEDLINYTEELDLEGVLSNKNRQPVIKLYLGKKFVGYIQSS